MDITASEERNVVRSAAQWARRIAADGWALVPLRLMVGFGMAFHGYAKLDRGVEHFAAILSTMGIPAPDLTAWATALLELLGGLALMLGAFVVPLSFPLAAIMATAMFGIHFRYGFSGIKLKALSGAGAEFGPVGYELNLVYIAALLTLAWSAATPFSVDRWIAASRASPRPSGSRESPGA